MGAWRCARKLSKLGKMTAQATAAAQENPVPTDLDEASSFYLGDTLALGLIYKELHRGGTWWLTEPSECGRKLRDIARVLEEWANAPRGPTDDPKRHLELRMRMERNMLATIGWLLIGKTLDEIRAGDISEA